MLDYLLMRWLIRQGVKDLAVNGDVLGATRAATLGALRDELIARGEPWAGSLARERAVRMALNQVMGQEATPLADGAEAAFFPPVTGG